MHNRLSPTMLYEMRFIASGSAVPSTFTSATYRALARRGFLRAGPERWDITLEGRNQLAAFR